MREEILRRLAKRSQQLRELHALRKEGGGAHQRSGQARGCALCARPVLHRRGQGSRLRCGRRCRRKSSRSTRSDQLLAGRGAAPARDHLAPRRQRRGIADAQVEQGRSRWCDRASGGRRKSISNGRRPTQPILVARATILNQRGTTLWNIGRLEAVYRERTPRRSSFTARSACRGTKPRALNNMGIVFAALGEYEEALAHYKSALKIDQELGDRSFDREQARQHRAVLFGPRRSSTKRRAYLGPRH